MSRSCALLMVLCSFVATASFAQVPCVKVEDFGAACDGSANDTPAFNDAVAATPEGGTLCLCDNLRIAAVSVDTSILVRQLGKVVLDGPVTLKDTTVRWTGGVPSTTGSEPGSVVEWSSSASGSAAFIVQSASYSSIENLRIQPNTASHPLTNGILAIDAANGQTQNRNVRFSNLVIDGLTNGLVTGIKFDAGVCVGGLRDGLMCSGSGDCSGGACALDSNNDQATIEHVLVANYSGQGLYLNHSQSMGHRLYGFDARANSGGGHYSVRCESGAFSWFGGFASNADVSNVYLGNASSEPVTVVGVQFESSAKMLTTGGPAGTPWPVTFINARWTGNSVTGCTDGTQATCRIVDFKFAGPFSCIDCDIGDTGKSLVLMLNSSGSALKVGFFSGVIRSTNTAPFQVTNAPERWTVPQGTTRRTASSNNTIALQDFTDSTTTLSDDVDPSKKLAFQLGGLTTARTITPPNQDLSWSSSATASTSALRDSNGSLAMTSVVVSPTTKTALGTPVAGVLKYCSTCFPTNPCTDGGTGAWAKGQGSTPVWNCQ